VPHLGQTQFPPGPAPGRVPPIRPPLPTILRGGPVPSPLGMIIPPDKIFNYLADLSFLTHRYGAESQIAALPSLVTEPSGHQVPAPGPGVGLLG